MSTVSDAPAVRGGRKDSSGGKQPEKRTGPVTFYRQVVAEPAQGGLPHPRPGW
ncbi:hypothetical protein [Nocardioides convexus]|uniref:hypothetical protein n=1 Tax=Nocardioides convexus TaxID=2712224 RepID=UPI0024182CDE|nr:hypothetical protein [Nocardioides convexus]